MKKAIIAVVSIILSVLIISTVSAENRAIDSQQVTVKFSYDSEVATIGQPFTIHYEIMGGSGQYEEIMYMVDEITEHCSTNYLEGELDTPQGSLTVVPESGESIQVWVSCVDMITGICWSENRTDYIACQANPDIPVSFSDIPEMLAVNESFEFGYVIGGNGAIGEARIEIWEFVRDDVYPECMVTMDIEEKNDIITYTPKAGHQLYIAIIGKDNSGEPFYAKTNRIDVDNTNAYAPVTVEYTYTTETAWIGLPFTVYYEIKGGSGQYEEIWYMIDEIAEHTCIDCLMEDLSSSKGSITFVPEIGEQINIWVSCRDVETGIYWNENQSGYLQCNPNPDIPVDIEVVSDYIAINETFSFSYKINDNRNIAEAQAVIWVFARNDTYPDCVFEQSITSKSGTIEYSPTTGSQLYIAVYGKDVDGRPFYSKTERLDIFEEDTSEPELNGNWSNEPIAVFAVECPDYIQIDTNIACYALTDESYGRMKQYYGGEPSWSFSIDNGSAVLNAKISQKSGTTGKAQKYNFEVLQWPTREENRVVTITCSWGEKTLTASTTICFMCWEMPTSLTIPSFTIVKVNKPKDIPWSIQPIEWQIQEGQAASLLWEMKTEQGKMWTGNVLPNVPGKYSVRLVYKSYNINIYSSVMTLFVTRNDGTYPRDIYVAENGSTIQIPAGIKSIADQAFMGTASRRVIIPDGCLTIGMEAFANAKNLTEIHIPDSVVTIDPTAFDGCGPVFIITESEKVLEMAEENEMWIPVT